MAIGILAIVILVIVAVAGFTRAVMEQDARACDQRFAKALTAQDSVVVAADGCGWLIVPASK